MILFTVAALLLRLFLFPSSDSVYIFLVSRYQGSNTARYGRMTILGLVGH
jgi:hypothetical protein